MNSNTLSTPLPASEALYFCTICNKPFKKEHSRNRHIPYCRRTHNDPRNRTRPCRECRDAKVKCSSRPRCSRCTRKGLECVVEDSNFPPPSESSTRQSLQPSITETAEFSNDVDVGPVGITPHDPQVLLEFDIETSTALVQSRGLDSFNSPSNPPDALTYSSRAQSVASGRTNNHTTTSWSPWRPLDGQFPAPSLSTYTPTVPYRGPMTLRKVANHVAQNNANYIIRALRTYPQRMLRRATFPPLLHRPWPTDSNGFLVDAPEPVANCMSIAQIFSWRTPENTAFVWRTIRAEQQRLVDEMYRFSKEELLSTLQVNVIYLIMRVADDAGTHLELDRQMVLISQTMCNTFLRFCAEQNLELTDSDQRISWEEWTFKESRRRLICLWFLMSRVASVKASARCEDLAEFFDTPLPSSKLLWEASTREVWEIEYELDVLARPSRVSTIGELIDAHHRADDFSNARLDSWNVGIDELGFLLNLAVSMSYV